MSSPSVLVIGEANSLAGHLVKTFFKSIPQPYVLSQKAGLNEVMGKQEPLALCDLVILLLQHPDEVAVEQVLTLFRAAPLARLLVITGAWCDGLLRDRSGWPPGIVVRAEVAAERLSREWAALQESRTTQSRPLSRTADRDEVFLESLLSPGTWPTDRGVLILIDTPDSAYAAALRDNCTELGLTVQRAQSVDQPEGPHETWLLFDLDPWPERQAVLARWSKSRLIARMIGLAGWPQLLAAQLTSPIESRLEICSKLEPIGMVLQRPRCLSVSAGGERQFPVS